jgi:NADPH:quinone reductase-like Zn-dependent oxidoreductase
VSKAFFKKLLKPGGKYVTVKTNPKKGKNDLLFLKELIEAGKLKTVIDKQYTLDQIREAHLYVEQFRKRGNVAVQINDHF